MNTLNKIQLAMRDAGEEAVIRNLEASGLVRRETVPLKGSYEVHMRIRTIKYEPGNPAKAPAHRTVLDVVLHVSEDLEGADEFISVCRRTGAIPSTMHRLSAHVRSMLEAANAMYGVPLLQEFSIVFA